MPSLRILAAVLAVFVITGCTPDALKVDVYTSDVEIAAGGEVIYVPAQAVFSIMGKDKENLLPRASEAAKKYLHTKSTFSESKGMMGRNLVVDTKLPMGNREALQKYLAQNQRLAVLLVDEGRVSLESTDYLRSFDSELSGMNMMLGLDLPAKRTLFNVVSDSREPITVDATAVFVSKKPFLNYQHTLERRDSVEIEFKGGDASVYSEISPVVKLK